MKELGMELIVGGHWHQSKFIEGELPSFIIGGNLGEGQWAASMLTLKDGKISMKTVNTEGTVLMDRDV